MAAPQRVAVLGATGSIGTSCLQVLRGLGTRVKVQGLTTHRRWNDLCEPAREFAPRWVVVSDPQIRTEVATQDFPPGVELLSGEAGLETVAGHPDVDTVIAGISGAAGLRSAWVAIEAGKRIGLANKETLVVAGPLVMDLARRKQATLIPVDSEHSAIFQALQAGRRHEVEQIILTASGGPFRDFSSEQLWNVTPEQALKHPNWSMGRKITIDSATLMNKALEVIEARWLFDLPVEQIRVVIHPQSVVHSCVEYVDGSVVAQMSPPDMKLPIQYALSYPARVPGLSPRMDWNQQQQLSFSPPDLERFPALGLGFEVARRGGTSGAVLNAANEVAVARFLAGDIRFPEIARACGAVLHMHSFNPSPTLSELLKLDAWARQEMSRWRS